MPYLLFLKKQQNLKLLSAANYSGALRVKNTSQHGWSYLLDCALNEIIPIIDITVINVSGETKLA